MLGSVLVLSAGHIFHNQVAAKQTSHGGYRMPALCVAFPRTRRFPHTPTKRGHTLINFDGPRGMFHLVSLHVPVRQSPPPSVSLLLFLFLTTMTERFCSPTSIPAGFTTKRPPTISIFILKCPSQTQSPRRLALRHGGAEVMQGARGQVCSKLKDATA